MKQLFLRTKSDGTVVVYTRVGLPRYRKIATYSMRRGQQAALAMLSEDQKCHRGRLAIDDRLGAIWFDSNPKGLHYSCSCHAGA